MKTIFIYLCLECASYKVITSLKDCGRGKKNCWKASREGRLTKSGMPDYWRLWLHTPWAFLCGRVRALFGNAMAKFTHLKLMTAQARAGAYEAGVWSTKNHTKWLLFLSEILFCFWNLQFSTTLGWLDGDIMFTANRVALLSPALQCSCMPNWHSEWWHIGGTNQPRLIDVVI